MIDSEFVLNLPICNLIRGFREDAGLILIVGFDLYFVWFDRMAIDFYQLGKVNRYDERLKYFSFIFF